VLTALYTGSAAAHCVDASLRNASRSDYYARVYSTLARQRLTLFRLSALPEGHNSYPEDYPIALEAARLDSALEQELLMVQTRLTDRSANLMPLLEMDQRLAYRTSSRLTENVQLKRLNGDPFVPGNATGAYTVAS
jgi:hypothetical protein